MQSLRTKSFWSLGHLLGRQVCPHPIVLEHWVGGVWLRKRVPGTKEGRDSSFAREAEDAKTGLPDPSTCTAFFPLLWTLDHCGRQEGKDRSAGPLTPHRDQAGQPPWGPTVVLPASSPGPARPLQQPPHLLTFSLTPVYTGLPHLPSSSPGEAAVNMFGFAVLLGTKAGGHHWLHVTNCLRR